MRTNAILIVLLLLFGSLILITRAIPPSITTFKQCVDTGNQVVESNPRQCKTQAGQIFVEAISQDQQISCTMDAMLCPDGSYVGRIPPECQFEACPTVPLPYTASFAIFTQGNFRSFESPMYHLQSQDVYLTSDQPNIIHVSASEITWGDFFSTLPLKIDQECLTTGTGQTFCTQADDQLQFYLNGSPAPEALAAYILPNQQLLVSFGPIEQQIVTQELETLSAISQP